VLVQDSRLSLLGPDSLDRLREEIAEIRRNIGTNRAVQMPVGLCWALIKYFSLTSHCT